MMNMTRRAALRGLALVSATAGAAGAAIAAPADDELAQLIDRHDAAAAHHAKTKAEVDTLEAEHAELVAWWPCVSFRGQGYGHRAAISFDVERFTKKMKEAGAPAAEIANLKKQAAASLRELNGVVSAHDRQLRHAGLLEAWEANGAASTARDEAFDAVLNYRPVTLAEVEQRNLFMVRACPRSDVTQHTMSRQLMEAILLCDSARAFYFGDERLKARLS